MSEIKRVLTKSEFRVFEIIRDASTGIGRTDIMRLLYESDPNGGPNTLNIVGVFANTANRKLAAFGLQLVSRGGPGSLWRLVEI